MKRLKKQSNSSSNHELQMFFEEISRIKTDMVNNYQNLKAVYGWCEHLPISDDQKHDLLMDLSKTINYIEPSIEKAFKKDKDGVNALLNNVTKIIKDNK